jgi:alpha-glucosidase
MKLVSICLHTVFLIISIPVNAQKNINLTSPDGNISFSFKLVNKAMNYSVAFKQKKLIDNSSLGLQFENDNFGNNLKMSKPTYRDTLEDYDLVVGKTSHVHTHYKEVMIPLEEAVSPFRKINFIVRIFNDGLAFRYQIPEQRNFLSFTLLDENTTFNLTGNPEVHTLFLPNYTSSHEGDYSDLRLSEMIPDTLMDMPALFEFPEKIYMAITEAELVDYAGMYLSKHNNVLVSKLSPLPNQTAIKVKAKLPHNSPWRVMLISDRIGSLIESNIITSLNEPCKLMLC